VNNDEVIIIVVEPLVFEVLFVEVMLFVVNNSVVVEDGIVVSVSMD